MDFQELKNGEARRTYVFPNGQQLAIENVARICVRPSGSHRLETVNGDKWIVPAGWLGIKVEAKEWSV